MCEADLIFSQKSPEIRGFALRRRFPKRKYTASGSDTVGTTIPCGKTSTTGTTGLTGPLQFGISRNEPGSGRILRRQT